jgi:hypothetical protein
MDCITVVLIIGWGFFIALLALVIYVVWRNERLEWRGLKLAVKMERWTDVVARVKKALENE